MTANVATLPPALTQDSPTAAVAAWCIARRLRASVVGRWVWVPYSALTWLPKDEAAALRAELLAAGFRGSKRRQAYFHECGVPARKRVTGSLERYHRTISAGDFMRRGPSFSWYAKGRSSRPDSEEATP